MGEKITDFYEHFCAKGVTVLLFAVGIFFWLYLRSAPFRPRKKGKTHRASFRALSVALAGTLGIGNIAGVSLALATGGAGALFWMWISALVAMLLKYAEIILAFRFRDKSGAGGAMYYMRHGIGGPIGRLAGAVFALLCLISALTLGGLLQAESAVTCAKQALGGNPVLYAAMLALLTMVVICGGVKSISAATVRLVPLMSGLYMAMCIAVLVAYRGMLPTALARICKEAFSPISLGGGLLGFLTSRAMQTGVTRGLLSNEAGCGTAPMAHVTSDNADPVRQGRMGMLEVFVDTVLICTLTGLAVLVTQPALDGPTDGMSITLQAFSGVFGAASDYLLTACVFFFAYATIICWAYYGQNCLHYFTSSHKALTVFRLLFAAAVFLGCLVPTAAIWGITDILLAVMTVLNLFALLALAPKVKEATAPHASCHLVKAAKQADLKKRRNKNPVNQS